MKKILLLTTLLAGSALAIQAQTLVTYSVSKIQNKGTSTGYIAPTDSSTALTGSNATLGSGFGQDDTFGFGGFSSAGGNPAPFPTSLSGAQSSNTYFDFGITPTTGNLLDLTSVDFGAANIFSYSSDTADYVYALQSSTDNFATSTSQGSFALTGGTTQDGQDLTLTGLTNVLGNVEFRLYVYRPDSTRNYSYAYVPFQGSFSIDGSASVAPSVPEPGTYALLASGLAGLVLVAKLRQRRSKN